MERRTPVRQDGGSADTERRAELEFGSPVHREPPFVLTRIGTMNRSVGTPLVRSPAFRRSGPAKAGTPNGRFMESPLSFFRMHWDHEPFHTPGQGTRPTSCTPGALTGRFMESLLLRMFLEAQTSKPEPRTHGLRYLRTNCSSPGPASTYVLSPVLQLAAVSFPIWVNCGSDVDGA